MTECISLHMCRADVGGDHPSSLSRAPRGLVTVPCNEALGCSQAGGGRCLRPRWPL